MDRNESYNNFQVPTLNKPRYKHAYTIVRDTTFNIGEIVPIYFNMLIQPGETVSINLRSFLKLTTSVVPATGNICCDIFAFAEDWQNVWDHTREFWGEDPDTPFEQAPEYTIPQFVIEPTDSIDTHDILHHISMPYIAADTSETPRNDIETERLCQNTYYDIYNWYFRDQNYIPKIQFSKGDEDINYSTLEHKKLLKAARLHDYFSGIPDAQKGDPSRIPLATEIPVIGTGTAMGLTDGTNELGIAHTYSTGNIVGINSANNLENGTFAQTIAQGTGGLDYYASGLSTNPENSGIIADGANAIAATINALRLVAAEQHIKESFAWYGSLFDQVIYSGWGVSLNAATMRYPEYLGGQRFWLQMDTVLATNGQGETQPLGDSAGYSTTFNEQYLFTKSFTTWQILTILVVCRQEHVYSQGLANQFTKKRKFDFYWDEFKGIGAQPRKKREIMLTGTESDEDTWNFAPSWQEYRFELSRSTGLMAPNVPQNLAVYNYGDYYENVPNAGQEWIEETPVYVDRTLVFPSTTVDQIIANFAIDVERVNIVPNFILPGIDRL